MVKRLVAKGADIGNRDNPFNSTPLSWAQHNKRQDVFDWLRAHCAIDLHDAVCFDLREHVEARLHEGQIPPDDSKPIARLGSSGCCYTGTALKACASHLNDRPSRTAITPRIHGSEALNPISSSDTGFWRDLMQSRKLRACAIVCGSFW